MRRIYLIKHASPMVQPDVPSERWSLSGEGEAAAARLGGAAATWGLRSIWTSTERKAAATARIIGSALSLDPEEVDAFRELHIPGFVAEPAAFERLVADILVSPARSIGGAEAAQDAAVRFEGGLRRMTAFPAAVVSHGRVITAWLAHTARIDDAFAFWTALPLAGYAVVDLDDASALDGPHGTSG